MPLASGSRTQMWYALEGTNGTNFGVIPTTGSRTQLRRTDDSLGYKTQFAVSNEVTSDRQTADSTLVGASTDGGVPFELSHKEYDPLLEAVMQSAYVHYGTLGAGAALTLTLSTSGATITAGSAPADAFSGLVGKWIHLTAPSDLANGATLLVTAATSTVLTISANTPIPGSGSRSVSACIISHSRLSNGTTMRSYTLEREHADITQWVTFRGMNVAKWSLSMQSGAIVNGSFDFIGKDQMAIQSTSRMAGLTSVVSQTGEVVNAVVGVGYVFENGAPISGTYIKNLNLTLDNKLRGRDGIGYLGFVDIANGTLEVMAKGQIYFADAVIYNKMLSGTRTSLSFRAGGSSDGKGYVVTLPSVKITEATITSGGKEGDGMLDVTFQAFKDPTTGKTILIDRVGS